MNKFRLLLAVPAAVVFVALVTGCAGGRARDAQEVAERFVNAFYSADYETAAAMCSPELEEMVRETRTVIDSLPADAQAEFMELSRGMQAHTVEVHTWSKDSVSVDFDIIYPGEIEPMKTSLTVVRNPDSDVWSVVYAQERM